MRRRVRTYRIWRSGSCDGCSLGSRTLGLSALLERTIERVGEIGGGLRDLPARQQTLHATLAWSTGLLAPDVRQAFGPLGLHRVEAGTLVDNGASQRVLEKNGFERIGVAPSYLRIAGAWRDHILFQRLAD